MTKDGLYKIGELAKISGLTTRTLRYYDELKLICPERSPGGQRVYNERAVNRLQIIESLKMAGFSLHEIRRLLLDWKDSPTGTRAAEALVELLQTKYQEVSKTVIALNTLKEQLERSISLLDNCCECSKKPGSDLCSSCEAALRADMKSPLIDEIIKTD